MVIDTETSPKRGYLPKLNITMGILVWVAKSFAGHTSVPAVFELQSGNGWHLLDLPLQEWLTEQGFHAGTDLSHDVQRSAEHKLHVFRLQCIEKFRCNGGAKFQSEHHGSQNTYLQPWNVHVYVIHSMNGNVVRFGATNTCWMVLSCYPHLTGAIPWILKSPLAEPKDTNHQQRLLMGHWGTDFWGYRNI